MWLCFCYTLQYLLRCDLISTWTDSENLPGSFRVAGRLASGNFSNKIIFPKIVTKIPPINLSCVFVLYLSTPIGNLPLGMSTFQIKRSSIQKIKVIDSGSAAKNCLAPLMKILGWRVYWSYSKVLSPEHLIGVLK